MTVLFATVLFLGAIAPKSRSQNVEMSLLAVGLILFVSALSVLATFPLARE